MVKEESKELKGRNAVRKCYRCDKPGHLANDRKCPALKVVCPKCKRKGHIATMCRSRVPTTSKVKSVDAESVSDEGFVCEQIVVQVENLSKGKMCPADTILVEGEATKVLFDSGAKIPIISKVFFLSKLANKITLHKPDVKPLAYGGQPIPLRDYFTGQIEFRGRLVCGKMSRRKTVLSHGSTKVIWESCLIPSAVIRLSSKKEEIPRLNPHLSMWSLLTR